MSITAAARIVYEQPLNERMRAFLRLEHLFGRAARCVDGADPWSSRYALGTLIDIMALLGRADLKPELIKELERHAATMESLARNPNVDAGRLEEVLGRVQSLRRTLRESESTPGHGLKNVELLSAVRQRASIPAGTCDFDLPSYHFWLQGPAETRARDLQSWLSAFDVLQEAISLCLQIVRESASATRETAESGFFQRTLDTAPPCQLIRVGLPADAPWFPEISAGKHRFTVRFMRLADVSQRPVQADEDVSFDLLCCVI